MMTASLEQSQQAKTKATRYAWLDSALKFSAIALGAVATISALAETIAWFTAASAAAAALITGVQSTFNPAGKATRLDTCAIDWSEFKTGVDEAFRFEVPHLGTASEAQELYQRLNSRWFALVRDLYLEEGHSPLGKSGDGASSSP